MTGFHGKTMHAQIGLEGAPDWLRGALDEALPALRQAIEHVREEQLFGYFATLLMTVAAENIIDPEILSARLRDMAAAYRQHYATLEVMRAGGGSA